MYGRHYINQQINVMPVRNHVIVNVIMFGQWSFKHFNPPLRYESNIVNNDV